MPGPAIVFDANLDFSPALKSADKAASQIQRRFDTAFKRMGSGRGSPLGNISRDFDQFGRSLDAATSRVLSFSAAAGSVFLVQRAIRELTKSTIDVEKSLADINVILNENTAGLQRFGKGLFDVSRQTAQSFSVVAKAATEFSRQGLGVEQTLKRTRDALVLTRLSGLDVESSVRGITVAINSFNKEALDSTTVINKLVAVDAAFALSAGDLAEALGKVGSSASEAGVSIDELLALVASVAQKTGQSGSVLGNSFRTIFQRLARSDTLDQLEKLGIEVRNIEGSTLPVVKVLGNLADAYDNLVPSEKSFVSELSAGLFQLNRFKAVIQDLSRGALSDYNRGLNISKNATNEAIERNERLNETLSALAQRTFTNLTQAGAAVGGAALNPLLRGGLGIVNTVLESSLSEKDAQSVGAKLGKGILEGIGNVLSGPATALVTFGLFKIFQTLAGDAAKAFRSITGLNQASLQRAEIESRIATELNRQGITFDKVRSGAVSVLSIQEAVLNTMRQQVIAQETLARLSPTILAGTRAAGLRTISGGGVARRPNFADPRRGLMDAIKREMASGVSKNDIRIGADGRLVSPDNPAGVGVYNIKDEPLGIGQGIARSRRLGIDPKKAGVPNFVPLRSAADIAMRSTNQFAPTIVPPLSAVETALKGTALEAKMFEKSIKEISSSLTSLDKRVLSIFTRNLDVINRKQSKLLLTEGVTGPNLTPQQQRILGISNRGVTQSILSGTSFGGAGRLRVGSEVTAGIIRQFRGQPVPRTPFSPAQTTSLDVLPNERFNPSSPYSVANLREGRRLDLVERARRDNARKVAQQVATREQRILSLREEGAGIFGGKARAELGRIDKFAAAEVKQQFQQNLQNKALIGSLVAPIVATTLSQFVPQDTRGGRVGGALTTGLGDIASFGALGFSFGGLPGAGIGAGIGIASATARGLKEFNDLLPELDRNLENSRSSLARVSDNFSRLVTTTEQLRSINLSSNATPEARSRATKQFSQLISQFAPNVQNEALAALQSGDFNRLNDLAFESQIPLRRQESANTFIRNFEAFRQGKVEQDVLFQNLRNIEGVKLTPDIAEQLTKVRVGRRLGPRETSIFGGLSAGATANIGRGGLETFGDFTALANVLKQITGASGESAESIDKIVEKLSKTKEGNKALFEMSLALQQGGSNAEKLLGEIKEAEKTLFNAKTQALALSKELTAISTQGLLQTQLGIIGQKGALDIDIARRRGRAGIAGLSQSEIQQLATQRGIDIRETRGQFGVRRSELFGNLQSNLSGAISGLVSSDLITSQNQNLQFGIEQLQNLAQIGKNGEGLQAFQIFLKQFSKSPELKARQDLQEKLEAINKLLAESENENKKLTREEKIAVQLIGIQNDFRRDQLKEQQRIELQKSEFLGPLGIDFLRQNLAESAGLERTGRGFSAEQSRLQRNLELQQGILPDFATLALQGQVGQFGIRSQNTQLRGESTAAFDEQSRALVEETMGRIFDTPANQLIGERIQNFVNSQNAVDALSRESSNISDDNTKKVLNDFLDASQKLIDKREDTLRKINENEEFQLQELRKQLDFQQQITFEREKIAKAGFRGGALFAGELRGATSAANEERIRRGEFGAGNLLQSFGNEFKFGPQDALLELDNTAKELAQTMKSGFKDAFKSFVDGSKNAKEALRDLGLTLAEKLLDKSIDFGFNALFSGVSSGLGAAFGRNSRNRGGLIQKFAGGGMVRGGSGVRDDVPAFLGAGDFVLRKSAVSRFQNGGSASINLQNRFALDDPNRPSVGRLDVDPNLSNFALADTNNPQNILRQDIEAGFFQYLQDKKAYEATKSSALNAFKTAKRQRLLGAYISALAGVAGAGLNAKFGGQQVSRTPPGGERSVAQIQAAGSYQSQFGISYGRANGGLIRGFANGGVSRDNIPALLTGGEFVVKKPMVDKLGVNYLNRLNNGGVARFQDGGLVGSQIIRPNDNAMSDATFKLIASIDSLKTVLDNKGKNNQSEGERSPQIIINNTFSTTIEKNGNTRTESNSESENTNQKDEDNIRQFNERLEATFKALTIKEGRQGGLLDEMIRRKTR